MVVHPLKKALEGQVSASHPAKIQPRKEVVQQRPKEKETPKAAPPKVKEPPKEIVPKEKDLPREEIKRDLIERFAPPFNLQLKFQRSRLLSPLMKY